MSGLISLGESPGFPSRNYTEVKSAKFLTDIVPDSHTKWRSPVTQSLIIKDLKENFNSTERPHDLDLAKAIAITAQQFLLTRQVKMIHLNDVFNRTDLDIWSKSPGLPWSQYGYKTKGDIRHDPDAIQSVRRFWHYVKKGHNVEFPDCCAYVQSHTCDAGEMKVRTVWGYPATVTFGEAVFALPLIDAYKNPSNSTTPIAYGFETLTGGMKKISNRFKGKGQYYVGLHFTEFDKKLPAWIIDVAFDILAINITFALYEEYGVADVQKIIHMFTAIKNYFINTKIRLANGQRFQKRSGIASGSYFTQLISSIANSILVNWAHLKQAGIPPADVVCLGDDSLIATHIKFDLKRADKLFNSIGMELNVYKSQVEEELNRVKFLGYYIGDGIPWKSREDWNTALLYPEKPDDSSPEHSACTMPTCDLQHTKSQEAL